jgi:hypothetical protein
VASVAVSRGRVTANGIIGDAPWPTAPEFHLSMMDWSSRRRRAITSGPARDSFPSLSPDGTTLAFTSGELGYDVIDVPLNGSPTRHVIATARRETAPASAPDGLHFAYVTDRSGLPEAENFNEFVYRGFSLHPDGSSFLTTVLWAKMQIYLMKDFDRAERLADRWWRRQ